MIRRPLLLTLVTLAFTFTLAGCDREYSSSLTYQFEPHPSLDTNKNVKKELTLTPEQAATVNDLLKGYFGTPRDPAVYNRENGENMPKEFVDLIDNPNLQLNEETLFKGSSLYRQHCLHCHGLVGNGMGSTGQFLNPRPRDFRQGKFKFRSTAKKGSDGKPNTSVVTHPSRNDLLKTLRNGVPTASMPAFNLLRDDELNALVSYVIHLSLRGQTEKTVADSVAANMTVSPSEVSETIERLTQKWQDDSISFYNPPEPSGGWDNVRKDQGKKGREIFLSVGGCVQCHGKDGTASVVEVPDNATRKNEWGDLVQPRNLTLGAYRGGSRPIDIFYRIKLGIAGSGMPAAADFWPAEPVKAGEQAKPPRPFTDDEIWYLVDYVLTMPHTRR